jgi:hypothetical protein
MNHLEKVEIMAELTATTPKVKTLCFDMDGTIADLYGVEGWLEKLRAYDATPYIQAEPMVDMELFAELLRTARAQGIEVRIITWLSKETTKEYDELVRIAKRAWLEAMGLPIDHFHGVAYGATKANSIRRYLNTSSGETAILFDDCDAVRKGWHMGDTYNPTECDICEVLKAILNLEDDENEEV